MKKFKNPFRKSGEPITDNMRAFIRQMYSLLEEEAPDMRQWTRGQAETEINETWKRLVRQSNSKNSEIDKRGIY